MTKEEIANEIETKFQVNTHPVKITLNDGKTLMGLFQPFSDFFTLRRNYKYRFVKLEDLTEFNKVLKKSGTSDMQFSVIINCTEVVRLEKS